MHKTGLFKKAGSILLSLLLFICVFFTPAQALQPTSENLLSAYANADNGLVCSEPILREDFADVYQSRARTVVTVSQEIKDLLKNAVLNTQEEVVVSQYNIPYSKEYLQLVSNYIANSVTEAFHVSKVSCRYYDGGNFYSFKFTYSCSAEEFATKTNEYKAVAQQLLQGIDDELSDVEKALLLHDRLALHCEYGNVNADRSETANVYAALVGRKPVCQGYAEAYLYLLKQVGISSELVSSDALNHAWNIVYIDGIPYHVDVTWDDPTQDVYGRVMHNNFLLSTNALKTGINGASGHNANDFTTTPQNTKYDSFFWQNSQTAFQLLDGEIYYVDNVNAEIRRMSGQSTVCTVIDYWFISADNHYLTSKGVINFTKLACVNNTLYCSMPTAIYEVNTQNGTMTEFAAPSLTINDEVFYCIRGFAYENNTLYLSLCNLTTGSYIKTAKTQTAAPGCAHESTELRNKVSATCGKAGYTGDTVCLGCGATLETGAAISATGNHTWNSGTVTKAATCKATGVKTYTCTTCTVTKTETIAIDAANHSGGSKTVNAAQATCGNAGYTGDTVCLGCGATLETGAAIPATGNHTWDKGLVTTPPTITENGIKTFTCTICTATKTENIDKLTADFRNDEEIAVMDAEGNIIVTEGTTVEELLTLASAGTEVIDTEGNALAADAIPGTGAALLLPDGTTHILIVCGDLNGDGKILANDARTALRYSVGLDSLTAAQIKAADFNNDGKNDAADARSILRYSVGLDIN